MRIEVWSGPVKFVLEEREPPPDARGLLGAEFWIRVDQGEERDGGWYFTRAGAVALGRSLLLLAGEPVPAAGGRP